MGIGALTLTRIECKGIGCNERNLLCLLPWFIRCMTLQNLSSDANGKRFACDRRTDLYECSCRNAHDGCMVLVRNYRVCVRTVMLVVERGQERGHKKENKEEACEFILLKELPTLYTNFNLYNVLKDRWYGNHVPFL